MCQRTAQAAAARSFLKSGQNGHYKKRLSGQKTDRRDERGRRFLRSHRSSGSSSHFKRIVRSLRPPGSLIPDKRREEQALSDYIRLSGAVCRGQIEGVFHSFIRSSQEPEEVFTDGHDVHRPEEAGTKIFTTFYYFSKNPGLRKDVQHKGRSARPLPSRFPDLCLIRYDPQEDKSLTARAFLLNQKSDIRPPSFFLFLNLFTYIPGTAGDWNIGSRLFRNVTEYGEG